MAVSISVCNLALGEIRAPTIADTREDTPEARACVRYYAQCLKLLLERHDWSFATRVASLAQLLTNDRASEWGYAFGLPTDLATPRRLAPYGFAMRPWWQWPDGYAYLPAWQQPFVIEAGTLYTNSPVAMLEYGTSELPEAAMTGVFIDALAYHLASRLAIELRDDRRMKGELLQQAEVATQRAVADDRNRQPQREVPDTDEVTRARSWAVGGGWCA
jgi:hypothetical protein